MEKLAMASGWEKQEVDGWMCLDTSRRDACLCSRLKRKMMGFGDTKKYYNIESALHKGIMLKIAVYVPGRSL